MKWNELEENEEEDQKQLSIHGASPEQLAASRKFEMISETNLNNAINTAPIPLTKLKRGSDTKLTQSAALNDASDLRRRLTVEGLSTSPRDSSFEWWAEKGDLKSGCNSEAVEADMILEARIPEDGFSLTPLPNDSNESFDEDIVHGVWGLSWGSETRAEAAPALQSSPSGGATRYGRAGAWVRRTAAFASEVGEKASTLIKRTSSLRLRSRAEGAQNADSALQSRSATGAFVLLPDGMRRRAWDALGLILLVLLLLVQADYERWRKQHNGWLYADVQDNNPHLAYLLRIKVLLDCFYMADIFVNFRTAYVSKDGSVVKDPWKIAAHYAVHWLIFDLFCALPLDLLLDEKDQHHTARPRPGFWGWVARRTRALAFLRRANQTSPLRVSRRVGQIVTHLRRTLRAFGGLSPALRGLRHAQQVVSIKSVVQGVRLLRSVGLIQILSAAPLARTLMGSFTFLRLLVSVKARGAVSALLSFLPAGLRGRRDAKLRGENPLVKILADNNPFSPESKGRCKPGAAAGVVRRAGSKKRGRAE